MKILLKLLLLASIMVGLVGCVSEDTPKEILVTNEVIHTFVGEKVTLSPIIVYQNEGYVYDHPFIFTSSNYQAVRFLEDEKNVFEVLSYTADPVTITINDIDKKITKTIQVIIESSILSIRSFKAENVELEALIIGQTYDISVQVAGLDKDLVFLDDDLDDTFKFEVYHEYDKVSERVMNDILVIENNQMSVVGYAKGFIRISVVDHDVIFLDVPFETAFKTEDVYNAVVDEINPTEDIIYGSDLSNIKSISIHDTYANIADYLVSESIERFEIKFSEGVISLLGLELIEDAYLLVPEALYLDYMNTNHYAELKDQIYPNLGQTLTQVVYQYKNTFTSALEFVILNIGDTKQMDEIETQLGYTFNGWRIPGTLELITTHEVTTYLKLESVWTINSYTITLDLQGGSGTEQQTYDYNEVIALPTDIQKESHIFKGWFLDNAFTQPFTLKNMPHYNVTLYAKWGLLVTLTFVTNGSTPIEPIEQEVGTDIIQPQQGTYSGHEFDGFYEDEAFTIPFYFDKMPSSDKTIYLKWDRMYRITFVDANGKNDITIQAGKSVNLGTVTKPNATFVEWNRYVNGQFIYLDAKFDYTYQFDITVYAIWQFTVTYVTNTPSLDNYFETHQSNDDYYFKDLTNHRLIGYRFGGWTHNSVSVSNAIQITANHTVSVRWNRIYLWDTGLGTLSNPFKIEHTNQWEDLISMVNSGSATLGVYFDLIEDLDFNQRTIIPVGNNNNQDWFSNQTNYQFMGTFNGNSHTISNYVINVTSAFDTYGGLFGYIGSQGVVKNLDIVNPTVSGKSTMVYVAGEDKGGTHHGAVAGINSGLIQNVTVTGGKISGEATLDTHHGGIAGYIYATTGRIVSSTASADINGIAGRFASHGGIVGSLNNGYLVNIRFMGSIKSTLKGNASLPSSVRRYSLLGGIAGVSSGIIGDAVINGSTVIQDSTSDTTVTPLEHFHGGIVGYMHDGSDHVANTPNSKNNLVIEVYSARGYDVITNQYEVAVVSVNSQQVSMIAPTRGSYFPGGIAGLIEHSHASENMKMAVSGYTMSHSSLYGVYFGAPLEVNSQTQNITINVAYNALNPNSLYLRLMSTESAPEKTMNISALILSMLMVSITILNIVYLERKRRRYV